MADELASELLLDLARAPAERHAKAITELRGAHARGRRGSALTQLARRLLGPERERPELGDEPFLEGLTTEVVQRNREAARRGSAWRVCVVHVEVLATLRALATTVAAPLDEGSSAAEVARSFAEGVLDAPHGLSVEADIPEGGPLLECLQQSLRALWAALPASTWAVLWAHPPP